MEDGEHLYQLLEGFDTAMLVTRGADGHLHARPMAVAELQADADAYFVTSIDSPKVAEIYADADVLLTFQSATQYAARTSAIGKWPARRAAAEISLQRSGSRLNRSCARTPARDEARGRSVLNGGRPSLPDSLARQCAACRSPSRANAARCQAA